MSGPERRVVAVHRVEHHQALLLHPGLGAQGDELLPLQSVADEVLGQVSPSEARFEERELRVQIGHAPGAWREDSLVGDAGRSSLREHDLRFFLQAARRDLALDGRERMPRTRDGNQTQRSERLLLEATRNADRPDDAQRRFVRQHLGRNRREHFRVDAQVHGGELLHEAGAQSGERAQREERVHTQGHVRLQPHDHAARETPQRVDLPEDPTRRREDRLTLVRERGDLGRAIPDRDPQLVFQIRHGRTDGGLNALQLAGSRGKTTFFRHRREGAKLVESDGIEHLPTISDGDDSRQRNAGLLDGNSWPTWRPRGNPVHPLSVVLSLGVRCAQASSAGCSAPMIASCGRSATGPSSSSAQRPVKGGNSARTRTLCAGDREARPSPRFPTRPVGENEMRSAGRQGRSRMPTRQNGACTPIWEMTKRL